MKTVTGSTPRPASHRMVPGMSVIDDNSDAPGVIRAPVATQVAASSRRTVGGKSGRSSMGWILRSWIGNGWSNSGRHEVEEANDRGNPVAVAPHDVGALDDRLAALGAERP